MKMIFLLGIFSIASFAMGNTPKLSCLNHNYRISLDDSGGRDLSLSISSETGRPLFPRIDPRIRTVVVGPMPCAQTLGHATVCFTDVCRYEKYYDFNGKELTDIEPNGDVLFTATPDRTHLGNQLRLHFEFNNWYSGQKYAVDENFEIYPGKYCDF